MSRRVDAPGGGRGGTRVAVARRAAGTSAAATATRRLLHKAEERELWECDGDLWCVYRPRLLSIMATAWWFTIMGCALLVALMLGAVLVYARPSVGVWLGLIGCALLAAYSFPRGRRALHADQLARAVPIDELTRVTIERAGYLRAPDGTRVPLDDIRVVEAEVDLGEVTRHDLVLLGRDLRWLAFSAGRARRLDEPAETLRAFGLRVTRRS